MKIDKINMNMANIMKYQISNQAKDLKEVNRKLMKKYITHLQIKGIGFYNGNP